jgi:hypothetical protein
MDYSFYVPVMDPWIQSTTYLPEGSPDTWRTPLPQFFADYPEMDNSSMPWLVVVVARSAWCLG